MLDIVNHSVKIKDIELLQFFYPEYITLNKPVLFSERPIIFTGETKYINQIKNLNVNYIIVTELAEFDLTERLNILDLVFSKWNKKIPKYLLAFYEELDYKDFIKYCKIMWLTGKWKIKEYTRSGVFLELLLSFKTDTYKITRTYLELLHKDSADYMELSLLTFLNKVTVQKGKTSTWYAKVIDDYKKSKFDLIKPAMDNYINTKIENSELRVFNLILDLNRRH